MNVRAPGPQSIAAGEKITAGTPAAQQTAIYELSGATFRAFAHSEPANEHARNAQCLLQLIDPDSFSDPEIVEALHALERRLAAIVEVLERPALVRA